MPARPVEHEQDMLVLGQRRGEPVEKRLHGARRDLRQHQREGGLGARLHGGVDGGERVALIGGTGRAPAAPEPAMADAALLSDAGLVLEHQAQALAGMCSGNRPQALTEPP